jgi:hypothetical protein
MSKNLIFVKNGNEWETTRGLHFPAPSSAMNAPIMPRWEEQVGSHVCGTAHTKWVTLIIATTLIIRGQGLDTSYAGLLSG